MKLDKIDTQLLNLLQANSKKTTKEYANSLNLSVTAVYERIKRLEKHGAIAKYVAIVNKKTVNKEFTVLCHVKLAQHTKDYVTDFEKEVVKLKEVVECYHISGDYDYILKVHVTNMEEYRSFMVSKLTAISHIGSTQSSFVITEVKHTTAIAI
ncbi:Lrp/AsnC family transcriptional regulator [Cellulophaga sp. L1A9]|uniref:Lrp/AsnC family transcriptional regulator n=1 Tax=Cellulophaga sp. L1A9 TaxID=2686362 RepID=UPI00131E4BCB|nr:Lrp/AsnC family transcriptional regulator [Cellulophaga sp. L1A9]